MLNSATTVQKHRVVPHSNFQALLLLLWSKTLTEVVNSRCTDNPGNRGSNDSLVQVNCLEIFYKRGCNFGMATNASSAVHCAGNPTLD